jgi:hypothetical protein
MARLPKRVSCVLLAVLLLLLLLLVVPVAEAGVLQALEDGKSDEEVMKLIEGGAVATPLENNRGERLDTLTLYRGHGVGRQGGGG